MKTTKYLDSEDDSTPSKRRKRDQYMGKVQTESFVMKLFDRSLDLSKYTEKTPLYPICRAWIANQPRNPNLVSKDQKEPVTRRENNGAELLSKIQRGERVIITSLPAPLNLEAPSMPNIYSDRKPNLEALDEALKEDLSGEQDTHSLKNAKLKLLAEHKEAWKKIKRNIRRHSCDKRYELNQLIIKKLFKSG